MINWIKRNSENFHCNVAGFSFFLTLIKDDAWKLECCAFQCHYRVHSQVEAEKVIRTFFIARAKDAIEVIAELDE